MVQNKQKPAGVTPQKPLQRAYQRDAVAIERWQHETFPAIAQQASRENADVFFWDESGFRADSVHGKTWAQRGDTPIVERPGKRQSMSAASAVNSKGAFWLDTYPRGLTGELFVVLGAGKKRIFSYARRSACATSGAKRPRTFEHNCGGAEVPAKPVVRGLRCPLLTGRRCHD